jgi:hypothetical protein
MCAVISAWRIPLAQNALPAPKPKRQLCGTTVAVKTASKAVDRQSSQIERAELGERTSTNFGEEATVVSMSAMRTGFLLTMNLIAFSSDLRFAAAVK